MGIGRPLRCKYNHKQIPNIPLSADDFLRHFDSVTNNESTKRTGEGLPDLASINNHIEFLDKPFTIEEIKSNISQLNRNKSPGIDNIVPEFFIDSKDFISPYLVTVFNKIYDNGIYPDAWTKGIIVPIFKKGAKDNPSNYRGITLVNTMAKLFSLCLTNRLNKYCENEHLFYRFTIWVQREKRDR